MKSMMLKGLIMVSAFAFMSCDESTIAAPGPETGMNPESSAALGPESSAAVDLESSTSVNPQSSTGVGPESSTIAAPESSETVNPASSETVPPASSETVTPASSSSEVANPQSSSSETVVSSSSEEVKPAGIFLTEGTDEDKNYLEVEYIRNTADNGGGVLCYPKQLSNDKKHGVILWGPGGGSSPNDYEGIIRRLASHGFVVVATSESPDGTNRGIPALNWLSKKNETQGDVLFGKLDMTKVGASGHSMGGLQSEKMLINDDRVITAVLNNSGAFNHAELANVSTSKTAAIVYGEGGMERPNAEGDYNNNNVKAPACLLKMTGGQGNECYNGECGWGHGSGPWGGMAATVAWMRWHLGGEDWRKKDFVGTSGKYIDGAINGQPGKWKGQCKNF
ncbi:esterase [Fibrobacter sp. UWR2]|uniref:poly(ethylene terephthalate) hydrolase family protein n=1 Tax=Fibrobacter sp. UWR2 TaxID=1964352 RepID=UPI000B520C4E|nr:esterase [Fibrobacter sp. UWR2]OWV01940.1 esterase [Fibrobacter sp. UWR2]